MGIVDVLQFHTFGTPLIKSCSCCGSKESSRGPKSHFWARIDLEHTFMLINVSPNWLFRWRKMQNRWSTVQTHSVLMILKQKLKFAEFRGQKSTWLPSYGAVPIFSHFLDQVRFLWRVRELRRLLGAIFALCGRNRFGACFIALNACSKLAFEHVF